MECVLFDFVANYNELCTFQTWSIPGAELNISELLFVSPCIDDYVSPMALPTSDQHLHQTELYEEEEHQTQGKKELTVTETIDLTS